MRLLILPLMLAALPVSAAPKQDAAAVAPLSGATCKRPDVHQAKTPKPAEARKLGELPQGDLILSVYNQVDGCMEPVIVRYGDGRAPAPAMPEPQRPRAQIWR